ncbi:hypothetical protein ACJQWK_11396 [Exserohilum turcicum]
MTTDRPPTTAARAQPVRRRDTYSPVSPEGVLAPLPAWAQALGKTLHPGSMNQRDRHLGLGGYAEQDVCSAQWSSARDALVTRPSR